jgi:hypothetical protein
LFIKVDRYEEFSKKRTTVNPDPDPKLWDTASIKDVHAKGKAFSGQPPKENIQHLKT